LDFSKIDLLKIDTEGSELAVLSGATDLIKRGKILSIQLENHMDDLRLSTYPSIVEYLTQNGFIHFKTVPHAFGNYTDEVFVLESVLNP